MMTRDALLDWVVAYKCHVDVTEGVNATNANRTIKLVNPKTRGHALLATPIDDTVVMPQIVFIICTRLGIPVPDCAIGHEGIMDEIQERIRKKK